MMKTKKPRIFFPFKVYPFISNIVDVQLYLFNFDEF